MKTNAKTEPFSLFFPILFYFSFLFFDFSPASFWLTSFCCFSSSPQALDRLSQELKLAVIEMDSAGMSASMYARHCTNHHVCLLIKTQVRCQSHGELHHWFASMLVIFSFFAFLFQTGDRLSVCGKSSSQALLGSVMDEIQKIAQSS